MSSEASPPTVGGNEQLPSDVENQRGDDSSNSSAASPPGSSPCSFVQILFGKLMAFSWIVPPALTLIVGSQVSFKVATIVACAWSWVSLLLGYMYYRTSIFTDWSQRNDGDTKPVWPKTFDVINPVATSILLPVALVAGEDFCRLWFGVIILGLFVVVCLGSIAIGRPLMADWIPLGENERLHPMMKDLRRSLTFLLGVLFFIMFASNLAVAIIGSEFGTTYVILNFVVPYGALAVGIPFMRWIGKYIWIQSAQRHYGDDWEQILFPDQNKEAVSENSASVQTGDHAEDGEEEA